VSRVAVTIVLDERELHPASLIGMLNGPTAGERVGGFGDERAYRQTGEQAGDQYVTDQCVSAIHNENLLSS
jgi:hypothetical protein